MKKHKYVKATLTLRPTKKAKEKMEQAGVIIQDSFTGTLEIRNWKRLPSSLLVVKGSLKPGKTKTKTKKQEAGGIRKKKDR